MSSDAFCWETSGNSILQKLSVFLSAMRRRGTGFSMVFLILDWTDWTNGLERNPISLWVAQK